MFILQLPVGQNPPLPRNLPILPIPRLPIQDQIENNLRDIDNFQGQGGNRTVIQNNIRQNLNAMREQETLIGRQTLRQGTPIDSLIRGLNRPTQFQADGSYRDTRNNTNYSYQWSGALYNSSGQVFRPGANAWTQAPHGLLDSTRLIGRLDLVPSNNGSYTFVRGNAPTEERNTAVHSLMPDGRIFRAAGRENGVDVPAGIFSIAQNGSVRFEAANAPMPGTEHIRNGRLEQTGTSRIFINPAATGPNDVRELYVLPNGNLLYVRATLQNNDTDVRTYNGTAFTPIGQVNSPAVTGNADIQAGVTAITTFRAAAAAATAPAGGIPAN